MKKKEIDLLLLAAAGLALLATRAAGIFGAIKTKTRFMPVYVDGKPNPNLIRSNKKKPGTYLIKVNGALKYIGYSGSNVYKTLLRHFQSWEDSRQTRVTYPQRDYVTARVIYTTTPAQAAKLEKALIIKYRPADNPNKYENYELDLRDREAVSAYEIEPTEAPF
jgi:hypothetical protein